VSKRSSRTGERMLLKPYPKDNERRTFGVRPGWLADVAEHIPANGIGRDDLMFSTEAGTPISCNTFRSRVWLPGVGIRRGLGRPGARSASRARVVVASRGSRPQRGHGPHGACADPDDAEVPALAARDRPEESPRAHADCWLRRSPGPLRLPHNVIEWPSHTSQAPMRSARSMGRRFMPMGTAIPRWWRHPPPARIRFESMAWF